MTFEVEWIDCLDVQDEISNNKNNQCLELVGLNTSLLYKSKICSKASYLAAKYFYC
ncbi:MAG: hypothetical protein OFPII_24240 [Osedax symbiont Rs1]|nr:MAG: hypothetical protein OFPII_24240 [Osedax symbiont Rs1]